jgi:hypothetical protein
MDICRPFISFIFGQCWGLNSGLVLASQVLHHLIQAMSPTFFVLVIFGIGSHFFFFPLYLCFLYSWDDRRTPPHQAIGWDRVFLDNFFLWLTLTEILLMSTFQVTRIIGMSHYTCLIIRRCSSTLPLQTDHSRGRSRFISLGVRIDSLTP